MQQLIKIEKRVIGAEETNSVNARELHKTLEIEKDFSDWVKAQIDRAGLRKDVDYATMKVPSEGVRPLTEYIITTDASKHIAMMSQGAKAKEVRDYFIAVEKAYKQELVAHTSNLSPALIETAVAQAMENILAPMLTEQAAQRNGLEIVIKMLHESKMKENALYEKKINSYKQTLSAEQIDKVNAEVARAARSIAQLKKIGLPHAKKIVYATLNSAMDAKSYHHILSHQFAEAVTFIRVARDEAEAKLRNIDKMIDDEMCNSCDDEYYDEEAEEEY